MVVVEAPDQSPSDLYVNELDCQLKDDYKEIDSLFAEV